MFLIVDTQPERRSELEGHLQSHGSVKSVGSWLEARKLIEAKGSELQFVLLADSILSTLAHPEAEVASLKESFNGLWVFVTEAPGQLFEKLTSLVPELAIECWASACVGTKIKYLLSEENVTAASAPETAEVLLSQSARLSEIGLSAQLPVAGAAVSFSPQSYDRGDTLVLASEAENLAGQLHHMYSFATSGALREVYQRVQKDGARESLPAPVIKTQEERASAVWVASQSEDVDSLKEYFPELPLIHLPHLGVETQSAAGGQGTADFFFHSRPGQLASFQVSRDTLKILGPWGTEFQGCEKFLGHSLSEMSGTLFTDWVSAGDRERFLEALRHLQSMRPLVNFMELLDSSGRPHFAEVLLDLHREEGKEFLLVRINAHAGELEDHIVTGHQQGLQPPDWPRWVILSLAEWQRVGREEGALNRLGNLFRKKHEAHKVHFWIVSRSPLSLGEVDRLLAEGAERVWVTPFPYRLMARQLHRMLGEPCPDLDSLKVNWSTKPQNLFFKQSVKVLQTTAEGAYFQMNERAPWVLMKDEHGWRWGRTLVREGGLVKVSWAVATPT